MKPLLVLAAAAALAAGTTTLNAQQPNPPRFFLEGLAGAVVPTFGIADVATTGGAFGAAVGYRLSPRWVLLAEYDYGMHKDQATETVDIKTTHLMGKVGYVVKPGGPKGWEVILNLGAGMVDFDVDGADSFSYFGINAGAKIAYNFSRSIALVLSPQGDIAFSKESELSTSAAWVWPVTAGFRVSF